MSLHRRDGARAEDALPRVFGRYLLVERLSRGGMGEIFLARHGLSGFEKLVVIKKVLPHLAADREFLTRFIDEAKVAVHLQHANVAQVYEVGRAGGEYFLALEYVSGSDLRATMGLLAARRQAMPVEVALFIAREVANGLAYAHRRTDAAGASLALVHCDISPPNLMLSFEGEVKIIDFGIARSRRRMTETNPDRGFGKFGYLAPEQLLKGSVVDRRTDVYALGVVLFDMLTGRRMFQLGEQPDYRLLARQVVRGQHELPSSARPQLAPYDELVAMALRPDPSERYQTAAEFRDAIQRALVAVNPTINPDHLAALLRTLHGDDVARRCRVAALDRSDVERWQRQLTSQAASTVSFATARAEPAVPSRLSWHEEFDLGVAEGSQPGGSGRAGQRSGTPAGAKEPDRACTDAAADNEEQSPTVEGPVHFGSPGRAWTGLRVALSVAVLMVAAATGAAAWYGARLLVWGGASRGAVQESPGTAGVELPSPTAPRVDVLPTSGLDPASRSAPGAEPELPSPPAPVLDGTPATEDADVLPIMQSFADIQVRELSPEEADAQGAPPSAPVREPGRSRRKQPERRRTRDRDAAPTERVAERRPQATAARSDRLDPAAVQRRFRAAQREYEVFRDRHGARLEKGWKDLAELASTAGTADRLGELDRKIDRFRARMQAIRADVDGSIDPF